MVCVHQNSNHLNGFSLSVWFCLDSILWIWNNTTESFRQCCKFIPLDILFGHISCILLIVIYEYSQSNVNRINTILLTTIPIMFDLCVYICVHHFISFFWNLIDFDYFFSRDLNQRTASSIHSQYTHTQRQRNKDTCSKQFYWSEQQ